MKYGYSIQTKRGVATLKKDKKQIKDGDWILLDTILK